MVSGSFHDVSRESVCHQYHRPHLDDHSTFQPGSFGSGGRSAGAGNAPLPPPGAPPGPLGPPPGPPGPPGPLPTPPGPATDLPGTAPLGPLVPAAAAWAAAACACACAAAAEAAAAAAAAVCAASANCSWTENGWPSLTVGGTMMSYSRPSPILTRSCCPGLTPGGQWTMTVVPGCTDPPCCWAQKRIKQI